MVHRQHKPHVIDSGAAESARLRLVAVATGGGYLSYGYKQRFVNCYFGDPVRYIFPSYIKGAALKPTRCITYIFQENRQ